MNEVAAALILKKKSLTNIGKVNWINFQGFLDFVILLYNIKSSFGTIKLHFNLFPIIKPVLKYACRVQFSEILLWGRGGEEGTHKRGGLVTVSAKKIEKWI